ncbi:unnamed protein product [Pleuronectes platessa]|uniref:Uncharacterized protein n=1 Tax=Pleuronectes platessa TaxID=8262 RepID=A0A9N7V306_PLEPL|nr:unnamed protein product [Pleuronectes platessa]
MTGQQIPPLTQASNAHAAEHRLGGTHALWAKCRSLTESTRQPVGGHKTRKEKNSLPGGRKPLVLGPGPRLIQAVADSNPADAALTRPRRVRCKPGVRRGHNRMEHDGTRVTRRLRSHLTPGNCHRGVTRQRQQRSGGLRAEAGRCPRGVRRFDASGAAVRCLGWTMLLLEREASTV